MSEQGTTKDQVSLDDLKRAIDAVEVAWKDDSVSDYAAAALRAEAWRTAFEWREQINDKTNHALNIRRNTGAAALLIDCTLESDEGMRLIREHLK